MICIYRERIIPMINIQDYHYYFHVVSLVEEYEIRNYLYNSVKLLTSIRIDDRMILAEDS